MLLKLIKQSPTKPCILDPIPTSLVKNSDMLDVLLPLLTKSVNDSLSSGDVPVSLKQAAALPLLKKQGLDSEEMKNYRPVSNLPYVSKLREKVVANQIMTYMYSNDLHEPLQSAYRPGHSTETAMLKIKNDIDVASDQGDGVLLVWLDLSAAFDTIDHKIMLSRLKFYCGRHITGNALKWFKSYMENRTQTVLTGIGLKIRTSKSDHRCASRICPGATIVLHLHASTLSNYDKTWYIISWIC